MRALALLSVRERSLDPLRSCEDDSKTSLKHHPSLCDEIQPHFYINNLSVNLKLRNTNRNI